MTSYKLQATSWCPYCMRVAKALHGEVEPRHRDIGICRGCGHTLIISKRGKTTNALRKPDDTDWEWIETNPNYLRLLERFGA